MAKTEKASLHLYGKPNSKESDVKLTEKQYNKLKDSSLATGLILKQKDVGTLDNSEKVSGGAVSPKEA